MSSTEENKFCTAFDYCYTKESKKFIDLIIKNCLTQPSTKRSLIIPPDKEITRINNVKSKTERTGEIMHYIFRSSVSEQRLKNMENGSKIYILRRNYFYNVENKDGKIFINDVEIKLIKEVGRSSLYKVSKKLNPIEMLKDNNNEIQKGGKKRKTKRKTKRSKKYDIGEALKTIII